MFETHCNDNEPAKPKSTQTAAAISLNVFCVLVDAIQAAYRLNCLKKHLRLVGSNSNLSPAAKIDLDCVQTIDVVEPSASVPFNAPPVIPTHCHNRRILNVIQPNGFPNDSDSKRPLKCLGSDSNGQVVEYRRNESEKQSDTAEHSGTLPSPADKQRNRDGAADGNDAAKSYS